MAIMAIDYNFKLDYDSRIFNPLIGDTNDDAH